MNNIEQAAKLIYQEAKKTSASLAVDKVKRELINLAMIECGGNKSEVARKMGVDRHYIYGKRTTGKMVSDDS